MMKSKKVLGVVLSFLVLSFVMTSFVNAGFGDFVRGLFGGEPSLAPFNATVTIQSLPPTIPKVFNVTDGLPSTVHPVDKVQPQSGIKVTVNVTFLADDANGRDDLPGVTIGDNVPIGLLAGNIDVNITYDTLTPRFGVTGYVGQDGIDRCNYVGCSEISSLCNPATQKVYTCTLINSMDFFYEPTFISPPTNGLWKVGVAIRDIG